MVKEQKPVLSEKYTANENIQKQDECIANIKTPDIKNTSRSFPPPPPSNTRHHKRRYLGDRESSHQDKLDCKKAHPPVTRKSVYAVHDKENDVPSLRKSGTDSEVHLSTPTDNGIRRRLPKSESPSGEDSTSLGNTSPLKMQQIEQKDEHKILNMIRRRRGDELSHLKRKSLHSFNRLTISSEDYSNATLSQQQMNIRPLSDWMNILESSKEGSKLSKSRSLKLLSSLALDVQVSKSLALQSEYFVGKLADGDYIDVWLTSEQNGDNFPFVQTIESWVDSVDVKFEKNINVIPSSQDEENKEVVPPISHDGDKWISMPYQVAYAIHTVSLLLEKVLNAKTSKTIALKESSRYAFQRLLVREASSSTLFSDDKDFDTVVEHYVGNFPNKQKFLKTLLFLHDEERSLAFNSTLVREIMKTTDAIGPFLTELFQDNNDVKNRTTQYMLQLSTLLEEDAKNNDSFKEEDVVTKLRNIDGLIPSMLLLDRRMIEDIASTPLFSKVLHRAISSSFVATFLFLDMFLLLALIYSFRRSIDSYLIGNGSILFWLWQANMYNAYHTMRDLVRGIVFTSADMDKKLFWNFGTVVNFISFLSMITCVLYIRIAVAGEEWKTENQVTSQWIRTWFAFTTALLWLRFLGFLKSINSKLATFAMAIVQITKDIFWYLVILVVIVIAFSQIFFTMLVQDNCHNVSQNLLDCEPREYYLRVYSILLGDWGLFDRDEDFHDKQHALIVFGGFTFFIAIVLLSVLIAIIGDSYTRCIQISKRVLGRSRVCLLTEFDAFKKARTQLKNHHLLENVKLLREMQIDWKTFKIMLGTYGLLILYWTCAEVIGLGFAHSHQNIFARIGIAVSMIITNAATFILFIVMLSPKPIDEKAKLVSALVTNAMNVLIGEGNHDNNIEHVHT